MLRRGFMTGLVLAATAALGTSRVHAAPKTYKYKCMECKLIQEYATPGVKKCPNDGNTMVRQN